MLENLAPYYDSAIRDAERSRETEPLAVLEARILEAQECPSFAKVIAGTEDVAVVAEHKRKSPSDGEINYKSSVSWTVEQYQRGGALAVSILTQQKHFGGTIEDLQEAAEVSDLPILRKDFIADEYQLYQARAYGAAAVLLIVSGLEQARLRALQAEASDIGLECFIEVHDEEELERAMALSPAILGINNRNLETLGVDTNTTRELIGLVPIEVPVIAESGYNVKDPSHIAELRMLEVDGVLIGTSLMRERDPAHSLSVWLSR